MTGNKFQKHTFLTLELFFYLFYNHRKYAHRTLARSLTEFVLYTRNRCATARTIMTHFLSTLQVIKHRSERKKNSTRVNYVRVAVLGAVNVIRRGKDDASMHLIFSHRS